MSGGDLAVEVAPIFAEFEGCQIPATIYIPPFPGRGEVGHTIDSCGHFLMNNVVVCPYVTIPVS